MNKLSEAICFATEKLEGQTRKGSLCPSVFHSLEAGYIAETLTDDENTVIAALLHDTIEDAGVTADEIRQKFGDRVAQLVCSETETRIDGKNMCESWLERKREAIETVKSSSDREVKVLYLADKLSNMRSLFGAKLERGDRVFDMFHQKDPKLHLWYYRSIADALGEFAGTPAYDEYIELINKTFTETAND